MMGKAAILPAGGHHVLHNTFTLSASFSVRLGSDRVLSLSIRPRTAPHRRVQQQFRAKCFNATELGGVLFSGK